MNSLNDKDAKKVSCKVSSDDINQCEPFYKLSSRILSGTRENGYINVPVRLIYFREYLKWNTKFNLLCFLFFKSCNRFHVFILQIF